MPETTLVHKNYKQFTCANEELTLLRIGHRFRTDITRLVIPKLAALTYVDKSIALSFMYALLEGISLALDIERTDIDGVIELNREYGSYDIILYDSVPGGAGHVSRLMTKEAMVTSLKEALGKVSQSCCDEDTSCYNCLRNYYNQAYHSRLKRKYASEVIKALLVEIR